MFFNQEKFLLTKIPLDDRGYIDLMVLKIWLLNVQDSFSVLSLKLTISLSFSFISSHFKTHFLSISINNGSDGDDTGNRRGTYFLEKKLFFSSRIEFFVCFSSSVLYYVDCVWLNMKWTENLIGFWVFEDERSRNGS